MKILIVQPYALGPGHYDAYTKRLCRGFLDGGAEISIVTASGTFGNWAADLGISDFKALKSPEMAVSVEKDGKSHRVLRRIRFFWTSWKTEKKALKIFSENKFDAVHFIDSEIISLALLFWVFKKPAGVFITIPGPLEIAGKSAHKQIYNRLRKAAAGWLFQKARIITHSQAVAESLAASGLAERRDISVIPWGVDLPEKKVSKNEAREKLGLDQNGKILGFFGYILPQKGFDFLLDTLPFLENCSVLSYVHSDKAGEKESFVKKAKGRNINLKFGFATEEELALHISACDAILLPYKKGFAGESGIMSLALSRNIPLITADTGKVGETVKSNNFGIVFEPESTEALRKAVNYFFNLSPEENKKIKQSIADFIGKNTWKNTAVKHLDFFQEWEKK